MEEDFEIKPDITNKLAVALDVDDLVVAVRLARDLQPYFGVAKVGLELFSAAGPDIIGTLKSMGYKVFLDLKLHDIPNTVGKAARVLGSLGIDYLTLHTAGGIGMLKAGVEGLTEGANNADLETPKALGVTILTSQKDTPNALMKERFLLAESSGCGGIVCAAKNLQDANNVIPDLDFVVPGIRPQGVDNHDQANVATPLDAISNGADLLVIGRAVVQSEDPRRAAREIIMEISQIAPKIYSIHLSLECENYYLYMPAPPKLTDEQRRAALEKAAEARRVRAELKALIKMGSLTISEVLDKSDTNEIISRTKVLAVLESMPKIGKVKARRIMKDIGIAESRRLRGLGDQQRAALVSEFS